MKLVPVTPAAKRQAPGDHWRRSDATPLPLREVFLAVERLQMEPRFRACQPDN